MPYRKLTKEYFGLSLDLPDPDDVRTIARTGDNSACQPGLSFWTRIWPASIALSDYLERHKDDLFGKTVLEIGAGIGLPSFVASRFSERVIITDHIPEAVDWMIMNRNRLGFANIECRVIDMHQLESPAADIILISDLGYHSPDQWPLHDLISGYITGGSLVLLSIPNRAASQGLIELLSDLPHTRERSEAEGTDVLIYRFSL